MQRGALSRLFRGGELRFPRVKRHIASSAAIPGQPDNHFDMVRRGLRFMEVKAGERAALDEAPTRHDGEEHHRADQRCLAGTRVSYGGTWTLSRDSRLAVVNMGYADGLSKAPFEQGHFYHKGRGIYRRQNLYGSLYR